MTTLALIGVGRWGKNILRTLEAMRDVEVIAITNVKQHVPDTINGVVVATPGSTHAKVALPYIKRGLPVFIEKPMATSLKDARQLERAAQKSGSTIFVGHVHLYNPAYAKLKQLLPKIGTVQLIHFEGMAPGPVRDDMSVLWDWGPHGVSMALDLLKTTPEQVRQFGGQVQAWGAHLEAASSLRQGYGRQARGKAQDFAHTIMAKLVFPKGVTGTMHLSWVWPEKRVKLTIIGSRGSLIFDDTAGQKVALRTANGRLSHPRYGAQMSLTQELTAFVRTVQTGKPPITDAAQGVQVVWTLAAIETSITRAGALVRTSSV